MKKRILQKKKKDYGIHVYQEISPIKHMYDTCIILEPLK